MANQANPDQVGSVAELGPNAGLVDEMYRQFQENPQSVAPAWREFFEDYVPRNQPPAPAPAPSSGAPAPAAPAPVAPAAPPAPAAPAVPKPAAANGAAPVVLDGDQPEPLRGAAARIVTNMEASLEVPTATSVRSVPAKLLEVNRQILNNHLARTRGGRCRSHTSSATRCCAPCNRCRT
jgi:2-oxoglutarate dehydrogenase complex dehydrogenase (E1) component-like enzyme